MANTKLSNEILSKIEKEHIHPKPRWKFLLKNYVLWLVGAVSVLIGGIAISVVIFDLANGEWDIYSYVNNSLIEFILVTLPYFWLASLAGFLFLANYNFKHTQKGYRYRLSTLFLATVLTSTVLGAIFYSTGMSYALDTTLGKRAPLYQSVDERQATRLTQPERGLLAGIVIAVEPDQHFLIRDFQNKQWTVIPEEKAILQDVRLQPQDKVRMIGKKLDEHTFQACFIQAWSIRGAEGVFRSREGKQELPERKPAQIRINECERKVDREDSRQRTTL